MKRSEIELPVYFDRYIQKTDDVHLLEALDISLSELEQAPIEAWKRHGHQIYAPGKWTIPDILQHLIDTERIFSYRALAFARGEKEVKSYNEDLYAANARADTRPIEDLVEEALALRKASIQLFRSFDEAMLASTGMGFRGEYSVHAIGFILAGHQRWHFEVIADRYLGLV